MPKEQVFANAKVVLPGEIIHGAVQVRDGLITDVDAAASLPTGAMDCEGATLCPGLIELHTDNLERHLRPRPAVDWPQTAAILGHDRELAGNGITTVFDAVRLGSIKTQREKRFRRYARGAADELKSLRAAGALKVSHHLHLRAELCSETLIEELDEFHADDRVGIVSLMDHTPGQRQFRDLVQFEDYVCTKNGMSRDGFDEYVTFLKQLQADNHGRHEAAAVGAAKRFGAMLASHDDTTPEHVRQSQANGVTLAEFPTTTDAAQTCKALGIATIVGAPNLVRGRSHSGNVAAETLAKADQLDILSSDYVPAALLLGAVQLGALWGDLARGIATVTQNPAQAVGLSDRGCISIGQRADLCLFQTVQDAPIVRGVWSQGQRIS
jgi:alpha-D-ribose 1-methylphosphonate 5-triphosphate diphosphatase